MISLWPAVPESGFDSQWRQNKFSLLHNFHTWSGSQPASHTIGAQALSKGNELLPPSSGEVNTGGVIHSLPHTPSWRAA
jgi:hypothetical protein